MPLISGSFETVWGGGYFVDCYLAVDQSHAFRIFNSVFYFPHFIDTPI